MTAALFADDPWIRSYHPAPDAAVRLLCFPHAGGSASFFFPVSRELSPDVDVLAVQYPGRQDRRAEPIVTDIGLLADQVLERLVAVSDDRPLALFGHSMGSLVAFEVAGRLRARGVRLAALIVSGRRAPHLQRADNVHQRSDDGLVAELKALSGTDSGLLGDDEILRMILPAIRGDYQAVETYRYQASPALECPVLALVGDSDPRVDVDGVREWEQHAAGEFELSVLPGGHFYLAREQASVLAAIRARIGVLPVAG
ncbi:pyochelin biosynthetic protein PchC [Kitasatospora sp. MAA4]|uniref:thioesterase II family protein n=1 Tax=Kitasatospora sp. MAA4 TaxID=3035093 RepID=UPI002476DFC7|nr:alpha/beta fold hydrolase [Kitasatospora sp. MAA4]MDH6131112.1 pyochelin biosynthetic protein PchC [Kitasatospora sp. MAA4]